MVISKWLHSPPLPGLRITLPSCSGCRTIYRRQLIMVHASRFLEATGSGCKPVHQLHLKRSSICAHSKHLYWIACLLDSFLLRLLSPSFLFALLPIRSPPQLLSSLGLWSASFRYLLHITLFRSRSFSSLPHRHRRLPKRRIKKLDGGGGQL